MAQVHRLHAEPIVLDRGEPAEWVVLLHGVFARGRNLAGIARRLTRARPEIGALLIDLPLHGHNARHGGDSAAGGGSGGSGDSGGDGGRSIRGMAAAVGWTLHGRGISPLAIAGHSLGGKVAAHVAAGMGDEVGGDGRPIELWMLDATCAPLPPRGMPWRVLDLLEQHPGPLTTRREASTALKSQGLPAFIATWLAGGLLRRNGRLHWPWNTSALAALLTDYARDDARGLLARPPGSAAVHVVKAEDSPLLDDGLLARLAAMAEAGAPIHLHRLPGTHWFHSEHPDALAALMARHLPAPSRR